MSVTYSECVFIQHAMRMPIVFYLPGSTIFFHIISFSGKKNTEHKSVFWFSVQLLSETFLILRRIKRKVIKKIYIVLHVKYALFLSDFNETWNFLNRFSKNTETRKPMKIRPVGAELLHADRQTDGPTDITNLIVDFRNFANAPNMRSSGCSEQHYICCHWLIALLSTCLLGNFHLS